MTTKKKKIVKKTEAPEAPAKRRGRPPKAEAEVPAVETEAPKKKRKAVKSAAKATDEPQVAPDPKPTASGHKDPNVGKEGFGACMACGWWCPSEATLCHHCGMPVSGRPLSKKEQAEKDAREAKEWEGRKPEPDEMPDQEPEEIIYYTVTLSVSAPLHEALEEWAQAEGLDISEILVRAVELGAKQMRDSGELSALPEKGEVEYDDSEDMEFQEAFEAAAR